MTTFVARCRPWILPLVVAALGTGVDPAVAQTGVTVGLAAGPLLDPALDGFQASGAVELSTPIPAVRLRLESRLAGSAGARELSAGGAVVVTALPGRRAVPYLLGGAGMNTDGDAIGNVGLGWSPAAGVRLGEEGSARSLPLFFEVRWHGGVASGISVTAGLKL